MALVKLLKVGATGRARQHTTATDELAMLSLQGGNVKLAGNDITSENTDGNINLQPNGTGLVQIKGAYTLPGADGTSGQILQTNGAGAVSFVDPGKAQSVCKQYIASGALATADVVYINGSGTVAKADASGEAQSRVVGIVEVGVADTQPVEVCSEGKIGGFTGLTPGARYFLDTAVAGGVTTTVPSDDEAAIVQIGFAASATEMDLQIEMIAEVEND